MRARKLLGLIALALVGVIVLAGSAFACVPFKGTAQVNTSGTGSGADSGTVTGNGGPGLVQYCGTNTGLTSAAAAEAEGGNTITVAVAASTGTCVANLTGSRNHTVYLNNATVAADSPFTKVSGSWSFVQGKGCFKSPAPAGNILIDSAFATDANGAGTKTYTLGNLNSIDGTDLASALCVGHPDDEPGDGDNSEGIFVPFKVTGTT